MERRWWVVAWRGVGRVGGWWEGGVWLVERRWAAVVEREVLGWWGGTEEGVAGEKGWRGDGQLCRSD